MTRASGRHYLWPLRRNSTRTLFLLSCSFLARAGTRRSTAVRWNTSREPWYSSTGWERTRLAFLFALVFWRWNHTERGRNRDGALLSQGEVARCISNGDVRTRLSRIPTARYLDSNAQKKHRMEARKSEDPRSLCAGRTRRGNERLSDLPFWYLQISS